MENFSPTLTRICRSLKTSKHDGVLRRGAVMTLLRMTISGLPIALH